MAAIDTIQLFYSGNGTAAGSLGGAFSGVLVPNNVKENLFSNVTVEAASRGARQYRCVYLRAANFTYSELRFFFSSVITPSPDSQMFAGVGTSPLNGVEQTIDDETRAPAGVVFILPNDELNALVLPDMSPNSFQAIWLQRVITANARGFLNDYARINLAGVQR
jgi:hypothetical protein